MLVLTKPRAETPSETQSGLARRSALMSGDWVNTSPAGLASIDATPESRNREMEERVVAGAVGLVMSAANPSSPSITRYHVEQEFEGVVLEVDGNARQFYARLIDETDPTAPDDEVLMSFDEISKDDIDLITPGALFSWILGRTERSGMTQRNSEIRFRRMFKFSKQSIKHSEALAADLYSLL